MGMPADREARALSESMGPIETPRAMGEKKNPWMESFWEHFKGENASLFV